MDILIVTGDESLAGDLRSTLESEGHHVRDAASPSVGLAAAKKHPPGCVVLQCSGSLDEVKKFRSGLEARCPRRSIPVLPLTQGDPRDSVVRGILEILRVQPERTDPGEPEETTSTRKILVVDDRETARGRLQRMLVNDGWEVSEAGDLRGGILTLLDNTFACLLVSAVLNGEPSHGVVRSAVEIRKVHPHPFAVVVLADVMDSDFAEGFLDDGVDDILGWTSGPKVLLRRLQIALHYRDLLRENRRLKEHLAARAERTLGEPAAS